MGQTEVKPDDNSATSRESDTRSGQSHEDRRRPRPVSSCIKMFLNNLYEEAKVPSLHILRSGWSASIKVTKS